MRRITIITLMLFAIAAGMIVGLGAAVASATTDTETQCLIPEGCPPEPTTTTVCHDYPIGTCGPVVGEPIDPVVRAPEPVTASPTFTG